MTSTSSNKEAQNLERLLANGIQVLKTYVSNGLCFYEGYVYDWEKFKGNNAQLHFILNSSDLSFKFDYEVGYSQLINIHTTDDSEEFSSDIVIEHLMNILADHSHAN